MRLRAIFILMLCFVVICPTGSGVPPYILLSNPGRVTSAPSSPPPSGITRIAHTSGFSGSGGGTYTSGTIDITGASLVIIGVADYSGNAASVLSDSSGNTGWTQTTVSTNSGQNRTSFYYKSAPTTSASYSVTLTGIGIFGSCCVAAYSGTNATPFDTDNGASFSGAGASGVQTGSVTPSVNNSLIISIYGGTAASSSAAVNSGLTIMDQVPYAIGQNYGTAMADLVQGAASPINPTWTWTGTEDVAVRIAVFKP